MHPFWGPQTTRLLDVHKSILICIWYSIPPHFCNSIVKGQWHVDQTGKLVIMCNSWFVAWPIYPELVVDELLNSRNKHTRLPTWLQRGLTRIPRGQATEATHRAPTIHGNKISLEAEKTLPAEELSLIPWISNSCYKHQPQFTAWKISI
jgi:hypothetical protein